MFIKNFMRQHHSKEHIKKLQFQKNQFKLRYRKSIFLKRKNIFKNFRLSNFSHLIFLIFLFSKMTMTDKKLLLKFIFKIEIGQMNMYSL